MKSSVFKKATYLFISMAMIAGVSAFAVSQTKSTDITVCVNKKTGMMRIPKGTKCWSNERKLVIAREGHPGAVGPAGPAGPAGPRGRDGLSGQEFSNLEIVDSSGKVLPWKIVTFLGYEGMAEIGTGSYIRFGLGYANSLPIINVTDIAGSEGLYGNPSCDALIGDRGSYPINDLLPVILQSSNKLLQSQKSYIPQSQIEFQESLENVWIKVFQNPNSHYFELPKLRISSNLWTGYYTLRFTNKRINYFDYEIYPESESSEEICMSVNAFRELKYQNFMSRITAVKAQRLVAEFFESFNGPPYSNQELDQVNMLIQKYFAVNNFDAVPKSSLSEVIFWPEIKGDYLENYPASSVGKDLNNYYPSFEFSQPWNQFSGYANVRFYEDVSLLSENLDFPLMIRVKS